MPNKNDSENKKKSKYFRNPEEKQQSKYIRSEDDKTHSRYIKTDEDRKREQEKKNTRTRRGISYHKDRNSSSAERAREEFNARNAQRLSHLPEEVSSLDEAMKGKGDQTAIFTKEKADKSAYKHYREAEETPDESRRVRQIVKIGLINIGLLAVAIGMNFMQFKVGKISYLPDFLSVEFSVIPEFIGSLAYGPVVGVAIALIKNVLHMIYSHGYASEVSNFILDSFFIFVGGWVYTRRMFNFKASVSSRQRTASKDKRVKNYRVRRILLGGMIGTVATSIATFFTTRYLAYPILIRQNAAYGCFTDEILLAQYQQALDNINAALPSGLAGIVTEVGSFSRAILLFNVPITFIKFTLITLVTAVLYPPISDFLHNRVSHRKHKSHR